VHDLISLCKKGRCVALLFTDIVQHSPLRGSCFVVGYRCQRTLTTLLFESESELNVHHSTAWRDSREPYFAEAFPILSRIPLGCCIVIQANYEHYLVRPVTLLTSPSQNSTCITNNSGPSSRPSRPLGTCTRDYFGLTSEEVLGNLVLSMMI
jgi:hypothetical protein